MSELRSHLGKPTVRRALEGRRGATGVLFVAGLITLLLLNGAPFAGTHVTGTVSVPLPRLALATIASMELARASAALAAGKGPAAGLPMSCSASGPQSDRCTTSSPLLTSSSPAWSLLEPTTALSPPALWMPAMVYDPADGYVLLIGGEDGWTGNYLPTEWTFSTGTWKQINTTGGLPLVGMEGVTWDSTDGYILLFGGIYGGVNTHYVGGQTWSYIGGHWTNRTAGLSTSPSPRYYATMADDPMEAGAMLFGGVAFGTTYVNDTWKWHAGAWTQVSLNHGPRVRFDPSLAYDAGSHVDVLFGGECFTTPDACTGTWTYTNGTWTNITASQISTPPARVGASMTWDAQDGYLVLFGGMMVNGPVFPDDHWSDTWKFAGGLWSPLTPAISPPARWDAGMAYDGSDHAVLLFGGYGYWNIDDSWEFKGGTWAQVTTPPLAAPQVGEGSVMVYDPVDHYVMLFGGTMASSATTWAFIGQNWTQVPTTRQPTVRAQASMAWDNADGYGVLFGGSGFTDLAVQSDTWTYVGGVWTNVTNTSGPGPSARWGAAMSWDGSDGYVLLFGGWEAPHLSWSTSRFGNDTWSFAAGHWTNRTAAYAPQVEQYATMADDASDGYVVLFGGMSPAISGLYSAYTWKYHAGTWTNITVPAGTPPSPRMLSVMASDPALGGVLLFGGMAGYASNTQVYGDTWLFSGGKWTAETTSGAIPSPRYGASATYDPRGSYVVVEGGGNIFLDSADTWAYGVPVPPLTTGAITLSRVTTEVGFGVYANVSATGGVGPLTYAWRGLPTGCTSANVSSLFCSPTATGYANLTVTVKDLRGVAATSAPTMLSTVLAVATTLTHAPRSSEVNRPFGFWANASYGIPPYSYAWNFGDASTSAVAAPSHAYGAAGTYNVTVVVTDSLGATVGGSATVSVVAGPSVSLVLSSTNVAAGSSLTATATPSGGLSPYTYAWSVDGSTATSGGAAYSFTAPPAGTHTVTVTLTDAYGVTVSRTMSFNTTAASSGLSSSLLLYAGIAAVVVVAAVLAVVLLRRRKKPGPSVPSSASPPPSSAPPPAAVPPSAPPTAPPPSAPPAVPGTPPGPTLPPSDGGVPPPPLPI